MTRRSIALASFLATLTLLAAPALANAAPFQLGLQDPGFASATGTTSSQIAFGALSAVHGSTVRLSVGWAGVAPVGATKPAGFDPANPSDPQYRWTTIDAAVRALAQHQDHIVINLTGAPVWAMPAGRPASTDAFGGAWNPNAGQFRLFARAAALRYSGHFRDPLHPGSMLPRVRQWEIWNEENLPQDLLAPNLVSEYRALLNAGYAAIKFVAKDNVVAIGGLAPVSFESRSLSPLKFAADLLCLRRVRTHFVRMTNCPSKAHFDVLAMHPYSLLATPTKHAYRYDDIQVADMGKLATLLNASERLHTASPAIKYGLWVTEWSWFTNPPDKAVGDPPALAARYTAYSMYDMWRAGVSLVVWFLAQDPPMVAPNSPSLVYGGGLYDSLGRPKPMMLAFRFPVVAAVTRHRGFVWGRAPVSRRTRVVIERRSGHRWRQIGTVHSGSDGVFEFHFAANGNGVYRARIPHGIASPGYNSRAIPAVRTHA
jgi:hypothetical protein